jgi:hypothetical protein
MRATSNATEYTAIEVVRFGNHPSHGRHYAAQPLTADMPEASGDPDGRLKIPHLWSRKIPHPVQQD